MVLLLLFVLGVTAAAPTVAATAPAAVATATEPHTVRGALAQASGVRGVFTIRLHGASLLFVASTPTKDDREALLALLRAAGADGAPVELVFDLGSAHMHRGRPAAWAGAVAHGGRRLTLPAPPADASRPGPWERQLARTAGMVDVGREVEARAEATRLITDPDAPPEVRAAARTLRAAALVAVTEIVEDRFDSPATDALLIEALADVAAAEAGPSVRAGEILTRLGAFPEAVAVLDAVAGADSGGGGFILLAMAQRLAGRPDRALHALERYYEKAGQDGMPYRYHRGWTLEALGRDEEAHAEYSAGLTHQRDYYPAYWRRACIAARLGRLAEAIADQRQMNSLMAAMASEPPAHKAKHERARGAAVLAELEALHAREPAARTDAPCKGYWREFILPRDRSPLLKDQEALLRAVSPRG